MSLLGRRLNTLRKDRHLSATKLAEQVGVSRSLISQIERGNASPSIETLRRIAAALDVPMGIFFEGTVEPSNGADAVPQQRRDTNGLPVVIHPEERLRLMLPRSSVVHELCTPLSCRELQVVCSEFGPKEGGALQPYTHPGIQVVVVLEGELTAIIGETEYLLRANSAITLDGSVPHRLTNRGSKKVTILTAMVPAPL